MQLEEFHTLLHSLGSFGYIGAFFAGALFVISFTVAIGAIMLLLLSERMSPYEVILFATLGAVLSDLTIFHIVKDDLEGEVERIYDKIDSRHHIVKLLHTKYFSWTLPVIGAIIMASPFPDEIGVSLLGIARMKTYQFLAISLVTNVISIASIVAASRLLT
jgi:hypothetical protein